MKKLSILFILIFIIYVFEMILLPTIVYADGTMSETISGADSFLKKGKADIGDVKTKIKETSNDMFNILFSIGVVITVLIGGILGIQFMLASAEDKAKIKEALIPYVIGCIVIYGAFGIWKLAVIIGNQIS